MCAKIEIPEALKADIPQGKWGKVLAATPVVMTVVATMLAGLASSEMTRAQYDRSLAAQIQSHAGDQWSYFQAKRLRAALQRNTIDILRSNAALHPVDPAALTARLAGTPTQALVESDAGHAALDCLARSTLPAAGSDVTLPGPIAEVLGAIDAGQPEAEIARLLGKIKDAELVNALRAASERVHAYDSALKPVTSVVDAIDRELGRGPVDALVRDFISARLIYAAQRYDAESRQNQVIAQLYELQVRKGNISAERHHGRSQRFFYGMLAAQMAVIISTFSIAARKKNFLWALAASAGTAAVGFACYVYLFV